MFSQDRVARRTPRISAVQTTAALVAGICAVGAAQAQEPAQMEEVIVTGSRLVRSDLSAPSPTTVIPEDVVQLSGDATVESELNE